MKCPINYILSEEDLNLCVKFSEQSAPTQQNIEFGQNDIKARDVKEIARDNLIGKIAEVAFKRIIEKTILMQGRLLEHDRYEELNELEENSLEDVDLFLVDLKFGNENKGPEFISKIRENYFTDILFYSSDSKALISSRSKGEFEGVFFGYKRRK